MIGCQCEDCGHYNVALDISPAKCVACGELLPSESYPMYAARLRFDTERRVRESHTDGLLLGLLLGVLGSFAVVVATSEAARRLFP